MGKRVVGKPFEKGHKLSVGADHRLDVLYRSKKFKDKCRDFLLSESTGVEPGTEQGGFAILKQLALGYKGVKPTDKLAALTLMAKISGELKEQITVERVDPIQELSQDELEAMARDSLKEIEDGKRETIEAEVIGGADVGGNDGEGGLVDDTERQST